MSKPKCGRWASVCASLEIIHWKKKLEYKIRSIINQEKGHAELSIKDIHQVHCYHQRDLILS